MYDVWQVNRNETIQLDGNGTRNVRVAIYCRVSTEHEEQLKALSNQVNWFNNILPQHPNWELVSSGCSAQSSRRKNKEPLHTIAGYYIDEGTTGLKTKNRPAFNQLIDDCKKGKIDLILTREVCRFSRNIVDAVSISRELKERTVGVAIFFYQDSIFTYDQDAEMKLGIFSTLAQNESIKVSERVRAGQATSRDNGVLYGNGNILGYDRVKINGKNCYVVNEKQADTVRRIFDLSNQGFGALKIAKVLISEGRLNASGLTKWGPDNINRILRNKVYCGYCSYNTNRKDDCLSDKRTNLKYADREFVKVSSDIVPPIIDEETWISTQRRMDNNYKEIFEPLRHTGKKASAKDVFTKKLVCKCGHNFKKEKWHRNASGITYGYTCYNTLRHGRPDDYSSIKEAEALNVCDMTGISEIKLKIQATKVFNNLFLEKSLITDVVEKLQKKYDSNKTSTFSLIKDKQSEITKLENKIDTLFDLVSEGIITKDEFLKRKTNLENQIADANKQVESLRIELDNNSKSCISADVIKSKLLELVNCENDVDMKLIDKFVYKITVDSPTHFTWQLHFKSITTDNPTFIDLCSYEIDYDYAYSYVRNHNKKLHKTRWEDIKVDVQIAI